MTQARISAREAHALMLEQGYLYLDVRTEEEFALGHPQGAYNIPIRLRGAQGPQDNADFMRVVSAAFAPEQKLVVGCSSGQRSIAAAKKLLEAGYSGVVEQREGYDGRRDPFGRMLEPGWRAAGLPCASEPEEGRDYRSLVKGG
jgi:rhodanese-related sulfurtransferase